MLILVLLLILTSTALGSNTLKTKKNGDTKTTLEVHLVPHTHDDPGWLKTVDQYYYGSNNTIYQTGVQYIISTVVQQLSRDPSKTFTYVEMSFFQRWYWEQTPAVREETKRLVKNGQLSFANGGWAMHDEASAHYSSMIDQTTLGHRFLKEEFDFKPRVGWQIDPFGHSATNAWLMSADVGFDALYFGRINYDDREERAATQRLEFVWQASKSRPGSTVFTGVFSDGNYQPPPGICFDVLCPQNQPVMKDKRLKDYNFDSMVATLIQGIEEEAAKTNGNIIMLKMGSDFHYQDALYW
jgi:alpha-mannosidase